MDVQPLAMGWIWLTNVSMPALQFPLPRRPFRHNLSYNLSGLQGPDVPHPWPEQVLIASSDENIFTHVFMKTMLCWLLHTPVYAHCMLVPVCFWSHNRYPCSHVTGGRRIYGSALFAEQTTGICLYSKDWVELEQLGKKDKNLQVNPLSCDHKLYRR